jgi:hypothetical protein
MDNPIAGLNNLPPAYLPTGRQPVQGQNQPKPQGLGPRDSAAFGAQGPLSDQQAMGVVVERAMEKLRSVVTDAREALGIPEGATIDTSAEATAGRIADFALGAYDAWRAQGDRADLPEDEARQQFVDFIGAAVNQGIEEARGILGSLQSLTPEAEDKISTITDFIQQRFQGFVAAAQ